MSKYNHNPHQHNEKCNCKVKDGHNHKHEHEHHHNNQAITITTHDMSIVGSYKFNINKPYDESQVILDDLLKSVANQVANLGGLIGHIKASISSQPMSCILSITEEESTKRYIENSICNVEGVTIVFLIEPKELKNILLDAFKDFIILE